jgi:hypothetical protein
MIHGYSHSFCPHACLDPKTYLLAGYEQFLNNDLIHSILFKSNYHGRNIIKRVLCPFKKTLMDSIP